MRIDRDIWRPQWDEGNYPSLPCPACGAPLNFDEDSLEVRTSNHNQKLVEFADIDAGLSRFSGWFVCGHSKCTEVVSVSGNCTYDYGYGHDGKTITECIFHPKSLHPGPPVIWAGDDVPQSIRNALRASFSLFWLNHEACAGRLRIVLELILENWGFPGETESGTFISLHKRIEDWHSLYGAPSVKQSLMAIKWLGNVASHETQLSRDRLLDAYEILSRLLRQLYPPDERQLDDLANEIVNSKGQQSS